MTRRRQGHFCGDPGPPCPDCEGYTVEPRTPAEIQRDAHTQSIVRALVGEIDARQHAPQRPVLPAVALQRQRVVLGD